MVINMEIMEAAALLGKTIKESELYRKFDAAKAEYEENKKLSGYLAEYSANKKTIERAGKLDDVDTRVVDTLNERLDELYKLVTTDPVYIAYVEAQESVNQLMEEVNGEITYAITGNRPCAHDCSSCGGGCGHEH